MKEFSKRNIDIECFRRTLQKPTLINRYLLKCLGILAEAEFRRLENPLAPDQLERIEKITKQELAVALNNILNESWLTDYIDCRGYILNDTIKRLAGNSRMNAAENKLLNWSLLKMVYAEETGRSELKFLYYRLKNKLLGKKVYMVCGSIVGIAIAFLDGNSRIWLISLCMLAAVMQYEINENMDKYL